MTKYNVNDLCEAVNRLTAWRWIAVRRTDADAEDLCPEVFVEQIREFQASLGALCAGAELEYTLKRVYGKFTDLLFAYGDRPPTRLALVEFDILLDSLKAELSNRLFLFVPVDQAAFWGNDLLFGKWPKSVKEEAKQTGNCYGAGLWTASVFHAMRVAEHGLRALAKSLKPPVQITNKGALIPIEYGDWNQVVTAIRSSIGDARKLPRNARQEELLQKYSDLADCSEYVKDIWRNATSHNRRQYTKPEALAAIQRVQEFMKAVSARPR